ncbi:MAG: hypothetical protein N3B13_06790 [Deltaproteobacteria bacterium]|nr:hypothetical protein [Deltaproteobacteria bacterium]
MKAEEIYRVLTIGFGEFQDSGIISSNGRDIKDILWEVDHVFLYPQLNNPDILYIVHHPVSRFSLIFEKNKEPDEESDNYVLEYRAKSLNLNLLCIHSLADKILERELSEFLRDKDEDEILINLRNYFRQYVNFDFEIHLTEMAKRLLKNKKYKKINVVVATYDYKIRKNEIYIDQIGATEKLEKKRNKNAGILIPHSVTDISAMRILEREIRKIMFG